LLYDERLDLPGLAALDGDIIRTLMANSADPIEVYREAMDLSRFSSDKYRLLLRDFLREKYANKKIDVAIAILGPSLDFLLDYGDEIFPGTPIVFCGVGRKELGGRSLPPYVHGVLVKREYAPTLDIALGIHPATTHVTVVSGTSEFDTRILDQAKSEFRPYEDRVSFTYLTGLPLQQILAELAKLPPHSLVLYTTFFQDGTGNAFITHDVAQRVSDAATAPVYGFLDQYLGQGIVGGSLYSFSMHGAETANLALRILAKSAKSEPSLLEPPANKVLFDWRQMQRWGISASALPLGSEIRFRDLTAWEQYRTQILGTIALVLAQTALIAWLMFEQRRRRIAEGSARSISAELAQVDRIAAASQLSASIAHEIKQPLTGIVLRASAALRWLSGDKPDIDKARDSISGIVDAGHHANDIVDGLRVMFRKDANERVDVDINKLITTVLAITRPTVVKNDVELQTRLDEGLPVVKGDEVQLQQVVLNLIMNGIESMQSTRPRVLSVKSASDKLGFVRVSIEDTGTGVDPFHLDKIFKPLFTTKTRGMGMGLSICQSIIEAHDGKIWVSQGANCGSIFQFELPADRSEMRHAADIRAAAG
jgi:signal transduction histidine kinase